MLRNAVGGGGVSFHGKKRYEDVRFNIISVTRGWAGVEFPEKSVVNVTLEWPPFHLSTMCMVITLENIVSKQLQSFDAMAMGLGWPVT